MTRHVIVLLQQSILPKKRSVWSALRSTLMRGCVMLRANVALKKETRTRNACIWRRLQKPTRFETITETTVFPSEVEPKNSGDLKMKWGLCAGLLWIWHQIPQHSRADMGIVSHTKSMAAYKNGRSAYLANVFCCMVVFQIYVLTHGWFAWEWLGNPIKNCGVPMDVCLCDAWWSTQKVNKW